MLDMATSSPRSKKSSVARLKYQPPLNRFVMRLQDALEQSGRSRVSDRQLDLLKSMDSPSGDIDLFCAGDRQLLLPASVSIVGTREVSNEGARRAIQLARDLVRAGITVVSGLARGVDTAAHRSAIDHGGNTISVIGTPLDKAYPAENLSLQMEIYTRHLLISPFADGETVFKTNFPKRNRVMAALSDATVIIEATDTSGTLHQAAECQRLGRWLFISKSVAEDPALSWPAKFLDKPRTAVLTSSQGLIDVITAERP